MSARRLVKRAKPSFAPSPRSRACAPPANRGARGGEPGPPHRARPPRSCAPGRSPPARRIGGHLAQVIGRDLGEASAGARRPVLKSTTRTAGRDDQPIDRARHDQTSPPPPRSAPRRATSGPNRSPKRVLGHRQRRAHQLGTQRRRSATPPAPASQRSAAWPRSAGAHRRQSLEQRMEQPPALGGQAHRRAVGGGSATCPRPARKAPADAAGALPRAPGGDPSRGAMRSRWRPAPLRHLRDRPGAAAREYSRFRPRLRSPAHRGRAPLAAYQLFAAARPWPSGPARRRSPAVPRRGWRRHRRAANAPAIRGHRRCDRRFQHAAPLSRARPEDRESFPALRGAHNRKSRGLRVGRRSRRRG
jgi:hypothetical protein